MKLFVKVLRGDGCMIEVSENATVFDVKKKIETELKVPLAQQTLIYHGRTLLDDKAVSFYSKIEDGAKLHLVVQKPKSLSVLLERFLRKYYSEDQTKLIMDEFMRDFQAKVDSLSLDDLERIATSYLNDECV